MFLDLFFDDFQISLAEMNSCMTGNEPFDSFFNVHEFANALSCMIAASCASQKGHKLFQGQTRPSVSNTVTISGREYTTVEQVPTLRQKMSLTKWKLFVKNFPLIFHDVSSSQTDPWWRIRPLIEMFNRNRREMIRPSNLLVFDESIFPFRPQISSTGNLPHLTYLPGKPQDLGPEAKVLMCSFVGCVLKIELMEGKLAMAVKRYHRQMGATAALVVRMHESWYAFI